MILLDQIKNIQSDRAALRKFGILMAVVLVLIGGYLFWKENPLHQYVFGLATAFLILAYLFPFILLPVHKVWMTLSLLMGWLMSRLILSILFYLVFTPVGLLLRVFRRRNMNSAIDRSAQSYWVHRERAASKPEDFERQF